MKPPSHTPLVFCIALAGIAVGQDFAPDRLGPESVSQRWVVVPVAKATASFGEDAALLVRQDSASLESRLELGRSVDSVVDLSALREPSPFRKVAVGAPLETVAAAIGPVRDELERIAATYEESGRAVSDCGRLALSVEQRIKLNPAELLAVVETELGANPGCACEVVKAAIRAGDAGVDEVAAIIEVVIFTAPEAIRLASQCAIASRPEALGAVQAVLARYDANSGESASAKKSAKGAKGAKVAAIVEEPDDVAAMPNPLDFPGFGPVGPTPGGQGGNPLIPFIPPVIIPPVTEVDP